MEGNDSGCVCQVRSAAGISGRGKRQRRDGLARCTVQRYLAEHREWQVFHRLGARLRGAAGSSAIFNICFGDSSR